jgi:hypothetical protein
MIDRHNWEGDFRHEDRGRMIREIDDHLAHLPPSDLRRLRTIVLLLAHDEVERSEGLLAAWKAIQALPLKP